MEGSSKLWGGRFSAEAHESLSQLNNSISVDRRLFNEDISGSAAYARALCRAQLITSTECEKIVDGLELVREEWLDNSIILLPSDEDVHTANERRLTELIGSDVGGKLHMGRSRNDQVATDMRLWMKRAVLDIQQDLKEISVQIICKRAEEWIDILMPGYTHLQRAQVVRFNHWLLSYAFYFENDFKRLKDLSERLDYLPLGCGAIAGSPFNINRDELAKDLGFKSIIRNSMMAVGDRDFVSKLQRGLLIFLYPILKYFFSVEFNFLNSLTSLHMSRFAEDLILFSSQEFGCVQISDLFSTGSSLMPQKRNPDSLELIRGISGEIFGQMTGFMMTTKGLPSTYNKDMQSDKKSMFETYDRLRSSMSVLKGVLSTLQVCPENCKRALSMNMLATDVAYYLVRKGVPFRTAHHIAGEVIKHSEQENVPLDEIPLESLRMNNSNFGEDFQDIWNFENSVEQYRVCGGTSKSSVEEQIAYLKEAF